jgi:hypothetical protein
MQWLSAPTTAMPDWVRTLVIAVFTSLAVVLLVEPVKVWSQRWFKKREIRRCLYYEMVHNYTALQSQVLLAEKDPTMKAGIGDRFAMSFKKSSYQLAQSDPATYYSLGYKETYWIDLIYRAAEHIITGRFTDDEQHLRATSSSAYSFLSCIKNRGLSKRLLFRVCPSPWRSDIRRRLAETDYVDRTPNLLERMRRRFD